MALPPSLPGGSKLTDAVPSPGRAVTALGCVGTVTGAEGVTAFDWADSGELPTLVVACTVKVYGRPFSSPLTRQGLEQFVNMPLGWTVTV